MIVMRYQVDFWFVDSRFLGPAFAGGILWMLELGADMGSPALTEKSKKRQGVAVIADCVSL
jgi:hypothetical protein